MRGTLASVAVLLALGGAGVRAANPVGLECLFVSVPGEGDTDTDTVHLPCSAPTKLFINDALTLFLDPAQWAATKTGASKVQLDNWESMCFADSDLSSTALDLSESSQSCVQELQAGLALKLQEIEEQEGTPSAAEDCSPAVMRAATAALEFTKLFLSFVCLTNVDGQPCPFAVAAALQQAGLTNFFKLPRLPDTAAPNLPLACQSFSEAGCCSDAYFKLLPAFETLMCISPPPDSHRFEQVTMPEVCPLAKPLGFGVPMPSECPDMVATNVNAPSCIGVDHSLLYHEDTECATVDVKSSCPNTMCQISCVLTNQLLYPLTASSTYMKAYMKASTAQAALITKKEADVAAIQKKESSQKADAAATVAKLQTAISDYKSKGDSADAEHEQGKIADTKATLSKQLKTDQDLISADRSAEVLSGSVAAPGGAQLAAFAAGMASVAGVAVVARALHSRVRPGYMRIADASPPCSAGRGRAAAAAEDATQAAPLAAAGPDERL